MKNASKSIIGAVAIGVTALGLAGCATPGDSSNCEGRPTRWYLHSETPSGEYTMKSGPGYFYLDTRKYEQPRGHSHSGFRDFRHRGEKFPDSRHRRY